MQKNAYVMDHDPLAGLRCLPHRGWVWGDVQPDGRCDTWCVPIQSGLCSLSLSTTPLYHHLPPPPTGDRVLANYIAGIGYGGPARASARVQLGMVQEALTEALTLGVHPGPHTTRALERLWKAVHQDQEEQQEGHQDGQSGGVGQHTVHSNTVHSNRNKAVDALEQHVRSLNELIATFPVAA